ncbi:MAG: alkylmercury lyase family protein [Anaerolineae bacterium]|nr:alkylmercury lyase family protein [Anaerolineae bacterium]
METQDEALIWAVRAFIYEQFAATTRPPTVEETAAHFRLSSEQAATLYQELHHRHALFLDAGTSTIRMANPFSAIPTPFRVYARGRVYWANCAWDSLGIPAALHSEARIETRCAESGQPVTLAVQQGRVVDQGELVHFLVPFRRWYDDLVFT